MAEINVKNNINLKNNLMSEAQNVLDFFSLTKEQVLYLDKHVELYSTSILGLYNTSREIEHKLELALYGEAEKPTKEIKELIDRLHTTLDELHTKIEEVLNQGVDFLKIDGFKKPSIKHIVDDEPNK